MTHARKSFHHTLRLIALAAALAASGLALADGYAEIHQLLRSGKKTEALAKIDQYLATKPRDPQMRFLKGVVQTEAGRTADAITTFSKLTYDFPELPEPYNNLAVLYATQSEFDKARAALEMAIRTNPSYSAAHENLGDVYAKLASQAYGKALQLDAGNTAVQPKLALIRELFGPASKEARLVPTAAAPAPAVATAVAKAPAPVPAVAPAPAPVAAAAAAAAAPAPAAAVLQDDSRDVQAALNAWATAWASKDMDAYLAAYGRDFDPPGNLTRKAWEEERRTRIVGKTRISVRLSDLAVSVNGGKATARFKQAYSADNLDVSSRKTMELQKVGERWVIVRENVGT